jgi:hypothetical protein
VACARARRRLAFGRSLAALAVLAATGCASGSGGAAMHDAVWREDLGRMTRATIDQGLAKMVQKYTLRINRREDRPREFYYELEWISRPALAMEQARGITMARNRIVLRGRLLESGFVSGTESYRVTWEVENEVTSAAGGSWRPDVIPPEVVEELRPMFSDLSMETRTGIRR